MTRRTALFAAAAVVAAAAGTATGLWRRSPHAGDADDEAPPDLWTMRLETLSGAALQTSDLRGKPLLLNFWATWCGPCVKEIPLLDAFARSQAARWNTLALAIDDREAVRRFIADRSLAIQIAFAVNRGLELAHGLGNSQNALPFTIVFDSAGTVAQRRLGALDPELLEHWRQSIS